MKIYFIRHAEGYHNFCKDGWNIKFPKLTDLGIEQGKNLGDKLKNIKMDKIIVSPLSRTLHTAELVFGKQQFQVLEHIREYIGNNCDLRESKVELQEKFPYADFSLIEDKEGYNNIENDDVVDQRLEFFYKWLIKNNNYQTIAIVSHGGFLNRFFYKYSKQLGINKIDWLDNCGVKVVNI